MKRKDVLEQIYVALDSYEFIDNHNASKEEVIDVIERVLDDYVIVYGNVVKE